MILDGAGAIPLEAGAFGTTTGDTIWFDAVCA